MRYLGSKRGVAKYIVPILENARPTPDTPIVDLFAGGFNLVENLKNPRIANDIDPYVTSLFREAVYGGFVPPSDVTKEEYDDIRANYTQYPKALVGFVGYGVSFGGKWFNGYAQGGFSSNGVPRNHASESARAVMKQVDKLQGVEIYNLPYDEVPIPEGAVIYCDPPYFGTTKYASNADSFDHDKFWQWCREKSNSGHKVFVSEYTAPDDFTPIWEKPKKSGISKEGAFVSVEKLFIYEGAKR